MADRTFITMAARVAATAIEATATEALPVDATSMVLATALDQAMDLLAATAIEVLEDAAAMRRAMLGLVQAVADRGMKAPVVSCQLPLSSWFQVC